MEGCCCNCHDILHLKWFLSIKSIYEYIIVILINIDNILIEYVIIHMSTGTGTRNPSIELSCFLCLCVDDGDLWENHNVRWFLSETRGNTVRMVYGRQMTPARRRNTCINQTGVSDGCQHLHVAPGHISLYILLNFGSLTNAIRNIVAPWPQKEFNRIGSVALFFFWGHHRQIQCHSQEIERTNNRKIQTRLHDLCTKISFIVPLIRSCSLLTAK